MSKRIILIMSAVAVLAVSCNREPSVIPGGSSNKVVFTIGSDQSSTKASNDALARACDPIDISEEFGIEDLVLTETETSLDALYAGPQTKGTPVYTENLSTVYSALGVTAYHGGTEYKSQVSFANEEGTYWWSHEYPGGFWPEDDVLFFIKAPATQTGVSDLNYAASTNTGVKSGTGNGTITFKYTSPGIGADNSATLQDDILFSTKKMNKAQNESSSSEQHKVLLYHALTGVQFKLNAAGENLAISSIDKITLSGIKSNGSCTIKPVYEGYTVDSNSDGGVDKSAVVSDWNTDDAARSTFSQTYGSDEMNLENVEAAANKTFMFVPQTITDDVKLTVTYTYKVKAANDEWIVYPGNEATIDFGSKVSNKDWAAGTLHIFKFSLNQTVDVEIDDAVDSATRTKSDLTITNSGTATSFMRVAVVGNWIYDPANGELCEDGQPAPAAITPCPSLPSLAVSGVIREGWVSGTDGFYYYLYPVPGGHTIKAAHTLFGNVAFTTEYNTMKPYEQCHLQIDIAVQAIRADQVGQVWPAAIVSQLEDDVID